MAMRETTGTIDQPAKGKTPVLQTGIKMLVAVDELSKHPDGITVSRFAEALEWTRATAHQYLQTAVQGGWAFQDELGLYRLSFHASEVGARVRPAKEIRPLLLPVMQAAVDELAAPVSFAVIEQHDPIIVERIEPVRAMYIRRGFESRVSIRSSASGQVLLAFSEELRRSVRLEAEVLDESDYAVVREHGYAIVHSSWLGDLITAVATPVFRGRACIGALSVIIERGSQPDERLIAAMLRASDRLNGEIAQK